MTASMIAVFKGPFPEADLHATEIAPYSLHVKSAAAAGGSAVVLATTASQMALSDPRWWTFH